MKTRKKAQMKAKLTSRAKQSLQNPNEITDEMVERAVNDAEEISKGRDVPYFAKEDFAYIRLKIYLKVQLNAEDEMIFEVAQKFIKSSPFVDDEGKLHSAKFYQSKMRKDVLWQTQSAK